MIHTGLTSGSGETVTAPPSDVGGSSDTDSGLSDHDDTQAQSDLVNDARANIGGNDQEYEVDAGGDDTNVEVTDQDGGATNGGTTIVDPDTSEDSTGDRVAITEGSNDAGEETTTVADEQGNTTTVTNADSPSGPDNTGVSDSESGESGNSTESERSVGTGTAAAALLVGAALVRGN
jgi:hypothetical protein